AVRDVEGNGKECGNPSYLELSAAPPPQDPFQGNVSLPALPLVHHSRERFEWKPVSIDSSALQHLAYLGRQAPSTLTPAELPRRGRTLTVWDVDQGDGKGEKRLKLGISWSADHRVVSGAELAAFVET
ncbi:hypothetical protein BGW80DRAFT_1447952, partial [Lactifluus volemus]